MMDIPDWSHICADMRQRMAGREAVTTASRRPHAHIDGYRLAERRKERGLSQTDLAGRMGVTKSRVSQIECGEVSTLDAIARYVQALGGQIQVSAVFGDDLYVLHAADPHAA